MKRLFSVLFSAVAVFLFSTNAAALDCSAKGAVLINGTTGKVLWESESDRRLPMASTTKIMTALLLCESGNLEREITVTERDVTVEGSSMGLLVGDTVSLEALLYGMMLSSGNDAANTVAYVLSDSEDGFVALMNKRAAQIGLKNTNFETPSGLDSENHYSTALDMALLARAALQNEKFREAASSKTKTLSFGNPPYRRTLKNHNRLLDSYEGLIGVKTGYTKKAGRCLVTAAERDSGFLIAVTLCDPDDWNDHRRMLDYGFSVLKKYFIEPDFLPESIETADGGRVKINSQAVNLSLSEAEYKNLEKRVYLPRFLYGANNGDTVGRVDYVVDETVAASSPIYIADSLKDTNKNKRQITQYLILLFKELV